MIEYERCFIMFGNTLTEQECIADVHEALPEGDNSKPLPFYLTELHRIIRMLMDETAKTNDQDLKVALATLEYAARKQKSAIEERLAMRN